MERVTIAADIKYKHDWYVDMMCNWLQVRLYTSHLYSSAARRHAYIYQLTYGSKHYFDRVTFRRRFVVVKTPIPTARFTMI